MPRDLVIEVSQEEADRIRTLISRSDELAEIAGSSASQSEARAADEERAEIEQELACILQELISDA